MAVLTGSTGALKYNNSKAAKVRNWSLTVSKDALEDTCIGTYDRSYVQGLRGATGSATLLYDPQDTAGAALLNSIFDNGPSGDPCEFIFNEPAGGSFKCSAFLTTINPSVSVGEAQAVSVSFQVSGPIEGRY